jgi:hypothetical protein
MVLRSDLPGAGDVDGANLRRGRQILGASERRGRHTDSHAPAGTAADLNIRATALTERDAPKVPGVEPEEPDLGRFHPQAHDGIEVAGIRELGAIAFRRLGRRGRMRVIEAHDLEPPLARRPTRCEVIGGVDHEAGRSFVSDIARAHRLDDLFTAAQEQPAAFGRSCFPGVRHDRVAHRRRHTHS